MPPELNSILDALLAFPDASVRSATEALVQNLEKLVAAKSEVDAVALRQAGKITHLLIELKAQKAELAQAKRELGELKAEILLKREQLSTLRHDFFGNSSEANPGMKRAPRSASKGPQPSGNNPTEAPSKDYSAKKTKGPRDYSGRGPRNWGNLERVEIELDFPKTCPCGCGGTIRSYDVDEKREVIPAKFFIAVRKYPRYRCRVKETTFGVMYKQTLLPGVTTGTSLLAYLVTMRYGWGLPLYRIENMLNHSGFRYYRSTMYKQIVSLADTAQPVADVLEKHTLDEALRIFIDESPISTLTKGKGKTGQSFMYAVHRDDSSFGGNAPRSTVFYHRSTRAMSHIHSILGGKRLIAQHDGYAGYGRIGRPGTDVENLVSVECWVHARRYFIKYWRATGSKTAKDFVEKIDELYYIEESIRGMPPDTRLRHRREHAVSVISDLRTMLDAARLEVRERSGLGKAINYTLSRWKSLTLFLDDGRIDLDTNPVERQFRPIATQRKGVLFIGSEEGGRAWALMSSLVETCKLNRIDSYRYFEWMIDDLAERRSNFLDEDIDFAQYLPWNAPESCKVHF